jgi:anaerobic ribonucleoside-triphosphate reductase
MANHCQSTSMPVFKIPCEIYSRACGYFRPVKQFNPGKQSEFWDRDRFLQSTDGRVKWSQ